MLNRPARTFAGADGAELAYREVGDGRPLVLLHGYLVAAETSWIGPGIAGRLAEDGRRVIMPDLRGHGASARPHDPAGFPPDALVDDGLALIDHLGLEEYDLGGYSVGGRVVARMLPRDAATTTGACWPILPPGSSMAARPATGPTRASGTSAPTCARSTPIRSP